MEKDQLAFTNLKLTMEKSEETCSLEDRQRSGRPQMPAAVINEVELDAVTQSSLSAHCKYMQVQFHDKLEFLMEMHGHC